VDRACNAHGGKEQCVDGKTRSKYTTRETRRRWDDNIKIELREMDSIHLVQDVDQWRALVNRVMKLWIPVKCCGVLDQASNWWLLKKGSASMELVMSSNSRALHPRIAFALFRSAYRIDSLYHWNECVGLDIFAFADNAV
jgi:hypothetical protein